MYESTRCKVLNRDVMKYLALVPMFFGHMIGWLTMMRHPENSMGTYTLPLLLQIVVDLALFCPPVMFFMVVDGYKYTKDRKKYALRLLLFACITQPFHWLLFQPSSGWWTFNVIFTLFFGLLSIIAWESRFKLWQRILFVILCTLATVIMMCDWIVFGVLFIFFLHIFRERPKARLIAYSGLLLVHTLLNLFSLGSVPTGRLLLNMLVMFVVLMTSYFCMTTFYNGKKGAHPVFAKWFFYAFYPLHYLVIFIVKLILDCMQ